MSNNETKIRTAGDVVSALGVRRGRKSNASKSQDFKTTVSACAWRALKRIKAMANDKKLAVMNPKLYFEANQWLIEMSQGKPRIQIDTTVTGSIGIFPDDFRAIEANDPSAELISGVEYTIIDEPAQPQESERHNLYCAPQQLGSGHPQDDDNSSDIAKPEPDTDDEL